MQRLARLWVVAIAGAIARAMRCASGLTIVVRTMSLVLPIRHLSTGALRWVVADAVLQEVVLAICSVISTTTVALTTRVLAEFASCC